jgi:UDP-N-acetylglucosamine diphosphorylase/glucosamine-1-phosphate N-acetyltransferase
MNLETSPTRRPERPIRAIVLAAGKGTRMGSDLPKVMHEIAGEPMVRHVVRACVDAGCDRVVVVVGYGQQLVRQALADFPQVQFAVQDEQFGTGHAVRCAQPHFETDRETDGSIEDSDVFVLCGDGPLIRTETLMVLLDRHRAGGSQQSAAATLATSVIADPTGYGRVVRDEAGQFVEIVEHKVATPEQLAICEVNPSYYCFQSDRLFWALERVQRNETSGEYYVTDAPRILLEAGLRVEVVDAVPPEDVLSINTIEELARVDEVFQSHRATGSPASAPARVEGDDR